MKVETGIFWVIRGEIVFDRESKEISVGEDFVNYSKSHFDMWDKLTAGKTIKNRLVRGDFATFPRGRLLYDVKARRYVLYADKCVTLSDVRKIKKAFGIERKRCEVRGDEHYSCDKCEEEKRKLTEVEEKGFCLQEGYRLTGYKGSDENVVIPETVCESRVIVIGKKVFEKNNVLKSVIIPSSVEKNRSLCIHELQMSQRDKF